MAVVLSKRWRRQPQGPVLVDWSHPLTRGLVNAWTGGVDCARGRIARPQGGALLNSSRQGLVYDGSAAGHLVDLGNSIGQTGPLTYFALFAFRGSGPSRATIIGYGDRAVLRVSSSIWLAFSTFNGTSYNEREGPTLTGRVWYAAAGVHTGAQNIIYLNGRSSVSDAVSPRNSLTAYSLQVGNENETGGARYFDGVIAIAAAWTRALSAAEIAEVSANPWQILSPLRPIIYSFPSASAAPTLSAATVIDITSSSAKPRVTVTF